MKAIIPVAGHGTRLEPHTLFCQKCLLPVAGKPVLEHILNRLTKAGIFDITLIIGHLGDQVREFCEGYSKANFSIINQEKRMGLGHAIYQGLDESSEPVLIVLGDSILELNYLDLISSKHSTIGVCRVPDPERFGIAQIKNNQIINVVEKPKKPVGNLALIGIYFISSQRELVKGIEYLLNNNIMTNNEYQLTDALQYLIKDGYIFNALEIYECLDCGIPETLLSTNKILLNRGKSNSIDPSAIIKNSHLKSSTISENSTIINSTLNNVITLPDSKLTEQNLENIIVGFGECVEK